jgi:outer membrane protein assembly factor BamB
VTRMSPRLSLSGVMALLFAVCAIEGLSMRSAVAAALALALSRASGPPTLLVDLAGAGFDSSEGVDVYFDGKDLLVTVTSPSGSFNRQLQVPEEALPGVHWVSAVGRRSGLAAQARFSVRTNWPAFRMNAQHGGRNRHENVLSSTTVEDVEELWATSVGGKITASPCVSGGQVYVTTDDGYLHAFTAASGGRRWSRSHGTSTLSSPAAGYSLVFAAWSNGTVAAYTPGGNLVWENVDVLRGSVDGPLSLEGGKVYFGSTGGKVYALDARTGVEAWSAELGGSIVTAPTVANGVVYVGARDGNLYALDAASGERLWSYSTGMPIQSTAAVANGRVFFACKDTTGGAYLQVVDARTGLRLWRVSVETQCSPAVAGGKVYVGTNGGALQAFEARYDPGSGTPLWSSRGLLTSEDGAPSVANGVVYVVARDPLTAVGSLNAVRAADGALLWTASTGGVVKDANPAISDGIVFIGSDDGQLHAYGIPPTKVDSSVKGSPPSTRPNPRHLRPDRTIRLNAPQRGLVAPPNEEDL